MTPPIPFGWDSDILRTLEEHIKSEEQGQYRLKIDVFSVDSLPMSRLAEYMAELAVRLGERERVHFSHLEAGSAVLVSDIEPVALLEVEERVLQVSRALVLKTPCRPTRTSTTCSLRTAPLAC